MENHPAFFRFHLRSLQFNTYVLIATSKKDEARFRKLKRIPIEYYIPPALPWFPFVVALSASLFGPG